MPKIVRYTLTWLPVHHVYKLHERQGHEALDIVPESQARLIWPSQISSFAFHGKHGSYTARKERKQRGGEYWCAYARVEGKLTKRYVGRGCDLTPARLEQVAQELWLTPQAALMRASPAISPYRYDHLASSTDLARHNRERAQLQAGPSPAGLFNFLWGLSFRSP